MSRRLPSVSLLVPLALGLVLSAGCQSTGMVSSIDDLTAQVDQEGFLTLQQQRLVALSGLIPDGAPGSLYRYRGTRSPFTAIGISNREAADDSERRVSYYVQRTIPCEATDEQLLTLRNKLVEVRLAASELIRARLERVAERVKDKPDATRIQAVTQQVETSQDAFDSAWKEVVHQVNTPGLMIVRTDRKSTASLAAKLGSILGLSSEEDQEVGGFAVAAGLRASFLYLGNDLDSDYWPKPYSDDWNLIGNRFPFVIGSADVFDAPAGLRMIPIIGGWIPIPGQCNYEDIQVLTSKFEAERVLYVRDQLTESRIQANLKASVDQLKNLKKTLSEVDEVAIDGVLESVESLGNLGILGAAEERIVALDPKDGSTATKQTDEPSWQTLYEVLSDYDDLLTFARGRTRLHLTNFF